MIWYTIIVQGILGAVSVLSILSSILVERNTYKISEIATIILYKYVVLVSVWGRVLVSYASEATPLSNC